MDTWPVVRSPSDVLRLVVAAVLLVVLLFVQWLWGRALVDFTGELFAGLGAVPTWLVDVIVIVTRVLAVVALVGGLLIAVRSGGWRMVGTAGLGAAIAALLIVLLEGPDPDSGTTTVTVSDSLGPLTTAGFPTSVGLGAVTAALTASAPWLSRRARRIGWALVIALSLNHFLITPASFDTLRAVLCGWLAGAAALVVLGGPSRRPTLATVSVGLAGVGVPLAHLEQASVDARGSTPYFGATTDGQSLFVKALGDDQRSADLLFRMYRTVSRHELGDERPFSSLRRTVEHEALVALGRPRPGDPHPAARRLRHGGAERLRPRLRGGRGPFARPGGARRADRSGPRPASGPRWRSCAATASPTATSGWPTSSSPPTGASG